MSQLTVGSLFSGSGGFELGAMILGMKAVWASEVEPFPILVTKKNFPDLVHLGDINNIKGGNIKPVDIITFGSPCQDLSIAGQRDGLSGSKSNLFYEAIRVIKEMRENTNEKYPRIIIWENVCGAFSSSKGEDFRQVLEQISKIKCENISIPKPSKWKNAGCIMGGTFSIAWRVLDAQYFGVPQRRKRIFLVADFTGEGAREILFNEESLPRYFESCSDKKQEIAGVIGECTEISKYCLMDQGGERLDVTLNKTGTLRAQSNHPPLVFENHGQDSRFKGPLDITPTLSSNLGTGGNNQPFVVENVANYDVRFTSLNTKNSRYKVYETATSRTLDTGGNNPNANQGGVAIVSIYSTSKNYHHTKAIKDKVSTLVASDYKDPPIINDKYFVRRITPLECSRLQGFPDYWCERLELLTPTDEDLNFWREVFETNRKIKNGKKQKTDNNTRTWLKNPYSDAAQYKMWGNGVALPCVLYIFSGVKKYLENSE